MKTCIITEQTFAQVVHNSMEDVNIEQLEKRKEKKCSLERGRQRKQHAGSSDLITLTLTAGRREEAL